MVNILFVVIGTLMFAGVIGILSFLRWLDRQWTVQGFRMLFTVYLIMLSGLFWGITLSPFILAAFLYARSFNDDSTCMVLA